jgi:putative salt-induced outer membrane protein
MPKSMVGWLMALTLLVSAAASAQDSWTARSELGFVAARGNSSTDSANAKVEIVREVNRWKYTLNTSGLYGKSADIPTAQRWDGRFQGDRAFGERSFWFAALRYEDDRYSGFDYQGTVTTGLGHKFADSETTKLSIQVGAGYRQLRPELLIRAETDEVIARIPGDRDEDLVVNGALKLSHALNDHTRVLGSLLTESGEANTLTRSDLSLEVKMIQALALAVGVSVRHNSVPQPGLKTTDTLTTVNLVYQKGPAQ